MNTYSFVPSSLAVRMFHLDQPMYTGTDVTSMLVKALGIKNFKKFVFRQELKFRESEAVVFAAVNPDVNPDDVNALEKVFQVSEIGIVRIDPS